MATNGNFTKLPQQPKKEGFIKIYRKIQDSVLWDERLDFFGGAIKLIMLVNYTDKKWYSQKLREEIPVGRGELITTIRGLSQKLGLSVRSTRTFLNHLFSFGFLTLETTQDYTKITIVNYNKYQNYRHKERHTPDTRPTQTQDKKIRRTTSRSADRVKKASKEKDPAFGVISRSLLSYMFKKTGVKQILVPKQMSAIKRILNAGYSEEDTRWAIDQLLKDPYWKEKGFDFMTVAGQLPKLKMARPKTLEELGYKHYKAKGSGKQ